MPVRSTAEAGTEGADKAAEYLAGKLKEWKLLPAGVRGMYFQPFTAQGKVEGVDADSLTISHGAIAELKWPAMTMPFNKPSPTAFSDVKAGDTVHFGFRKKGDEYELVSVHRMGGAK